MHSDTRAIALPAAITGSLPRRAWYTGNPGMRSVCRTHRRSQFRQPGLRITAGVAARVMPPALLWIVVKA
jgi:hypothetical protein